MTDDTDKLLSAYGWTMECKSPLEIRHADGSFATLNAARIVIDALRVEEPIEGRTEN